MTRELISDYKGEKNVTKITNDETGAVSYLTQSTTISDEMNRVGADGFVTLENEKKHVLFLYNAADAEVGRYYLGKNLQQLGDEKLSTMKHVLCVFKSWNPNATDSEGNITGAWVPCIGLSKQESLASKKRSFV